MALPLYTSGDSGDPSNAAGYLQKLINHVTQNNTNTNELETARGVYANLNLRITADETNLGANYSTTTVMQAFVNGQIATGGVGWDTFGSPLQPLRLNAAGDAPEGYEPGNNLAPILLLGGL